MAQLIGDGPNRGRSAPPPRRLPKPRPVDDGPRGERTNRPVQQPSLPKAKFSKRTPDKFSTPFWGDLLDFGKKASPRQEAEDKKFYADLDEQMKSQIRGERTEDGPMSVFRGVLPDIEKQKADAQIVQNVADQYNVKARLGKRDQARIAREAKDRTEKDKVLTAQQWGRLTPMQQAAVQANADLADAIAKDFRDQGKHDSNRNGDDSQYKAHEKRVLDLFGEEGRLGFKGLEYAPNTLAFLDKRGIDRAALGGRTLDDIVSGDTLFDMDTVEAIGKKAPQAGLAPADARYKNIEFAKRLAAGQLQYQEELANALQRGKQLLSGTSGRTTSAAATNSYGAKEAAPTRYTALRPETAERLETYMQILARTDSPLNEALGVIEADLAERGASPQESTQVWENMIERARMATTGEGKWFDDVDFKMRGPDEVAKALGATTLKRREAK